VTEPFPLEFANDDIPFPFGIVEKTLTFDVGFRYQSSATWSVEGEVGVVDAENREHVEGDDELEMRGDLSVQIALWRWFD
jgi:hypothetical protein